MRRLLPSIISLAALAPAQAQGLTWPDVSARVEQSLSSADPATRRAGALELASLGRSRAKAWVLRALRDTDSDVRVAAADAAIRLDVREAGDEVAPWLGEREARLRAKACEVARAMPTKALVPQLGRALGDADAQVRIAAAEALGASGSGEAVPPLLGKLDDTSAPVRIAIVRALSQLRDERAVVPLVGKVNDSVGDVRREVARALGELADARAAQPLTLQLRDPLPEVRVEAISAIGHLRAPEAVDALAPLVTDRTPAVRHAALESLGRTAGDRALRVLASTLGRDEDALGTLDATPVREALVSAGDAAVPVVHDVLVGTSTSAATTSAAWILGELRATKEAPAIVAALRRGALPPPAAMRALGRLGSSEQIPVVLETLTDANANAREEAAAAARILLDPDRPDGRAVEPIAAALSDPRTPQAEHPRLVELLGRTGSPRAAAILVPLMRSKSDLIALAAIDAIGALGAGAHVAEDDLVELTLHGEPDRRLRAAVALGACGTDRSTSALARALGESNEIDRHAALTALGGTLARAANEHVAAQLARALELAVDADRDAFIEAIGFARTPASRASLASIVASGSIADRRAVARALSAQSPADAESTLVRLLEDPDASVRAEAAWTAGSLANAHVLQRIETLARDGDASVATNATAALGRTFAARTDAARASRALCPLLELPSTTPLARANALTGLWLARARCEGGKERALLGAGPDIVRAAAARTLATRPDADDAKALEKCRDADRSPRVAQACRTRPEAPSSGRRALVAYVVAAGSPRPAAGAGYALAMADGLIHVGVTDRRGAASDPAAPAGSVSLLSADAQTRK